MSVLQGNLCKLSSMLTSYRNLCCQRITVTTAQRHYTKVSIEEKLGLKPKPKRPPTTFLRFINKIQPTILQKHPGVEYKQIVKLAAEEWKKADGKLKNELLEDFKADWVKYQEMLKEYDKNLSPGDREEIETAKTAIKIAKEKLELRKKQEELGKPRKPPTPYLKFLLTKSPERGKTPFKDWQLKVSKMWSSLSEAEKSKFSANYKIDLANYREKLSQWEKKMIKEGKKDVVWS